MEQAFAALILGIVQGLTEFLPISSSGHLVVLPQIFGWGGVVGSLEFDVALHLGSTLAVVGFFWKDWVSVFRHFVGAAIDGQQKIMSDPKSRLLVLIIAGSIPAGLVGFVFKDFIETSVRSSLLVGFNLVFFGLLLWYVDRFAHKRGIETVGWKDAVVVGVAQAVSLIPGVSRSGITISAARSQKLKREDAVRFSFLLSTPAIIGAGLLTFKDLVEIGFTQRLGSIFLVGFLAAALSGWLTIKFLLNFVKNRGFTVFVIYRILLGVFLIAWALWT